MGCLAKKSASYYFLKFYCDSSWFIIPQWIWSVCFRQIPRAINSQQVTAGKTRALKISQSCKLAKLWIIHFFLKGSFFPDGKPTTTTFYYCCGNICQSLTCRTFWKHLSWKGTGVPMIQSLGFIIKKVNKT